MASLRIRLYDCDVSFHNIDLRPINYEMLQLQSVSLNTTLLIWSCSYSATFNHLQFEEFCPKLLGLGPKLPVGTNKIMDMI